VLFHTGLSAGRNLLRNGIQVVLAHLGLYRSRGLRRAADAFAILVEGVGSCPGFFAIITSDSVSMAIGIRCVAQILVLRLGGLHGLGVLQTADARVTRLVKDMLPNIAPLMADATLLAVFLGAPLQPAAKLVAESGMLSISGIAANSIAELAGILLLRSLCAGGLLNGDPLHALLAVLLPIAVLVAD
jgi:hypothetical protein